MIRRWLRRLGLLAVLVGFVLVGVGDSLPAGIDGAGVVTVGSVAVLLLGGVATLAGLWTALDRHAQEGSRWRPAATERGYSVAVPGDELADAPGREIEAQVRDRVVASLVAARDCSRDEALEQVENGTWTDDPLAAAYLGRTSIRVPLSTRFVAFLRNEPVEDRALRRTVAALRDRRRRRRD